MNRKRLLVISALLLTSLVVFLWISNSVDKIAHSKPYGSYISSPSIDRSKEDKVFIDEYRIYDSIYFSEDGLQSYTIGDVWIEKNSNNVNKYPETSHSTCILTILFNQLTRNDLHEFRLLEIDSIGYKLTNSQREHPDGYPRIRFLLNDSPERFSLEVIERNPQDSLAWLTDKVIDTLHFVKEN